MLRQMNDNSSPTLIKSTDSSDKGDTVRKPTTENGSTTKQHESSLLLPQMNGPYDVLCGRGGGSNSHIGNRRFRAVVASHQAEYLHARKNDKIAISRQVVAAVQAQGGRFLSRNKAGDWVEVPESKALSKTSQALREGLDVRNNKVREKKVQQRAIDATPSDGLRARHHHGLDLSNHTVQSHRLPISPCSTATDSSVVEEEMLRRLVEQARYQALLRATRQY